MRTVAAVALPLMATASVLPIPFAPVALLKAVEAPEPHVEVFHTAVSHALALEGLALSVGENSARL